MNLFVVRTWLQARFSKTERGASGQHRDEIRQSRGEPRGQGKFSDESRDHTLFGRYSCNGLIGFVPAKVKIDSVLRVQQKGGSW